MNTDPTRTCIAFSGHRSLGRGPLDQVALAAKTELDARFDATVLIFDDTTSEPVEVDFRGEPQDVLDRLAAAMVVAQVAEGTGERRSPGRPKLGVVAREVTLLPRHWEWLSAQPGGASAAIRRLVEEARRNDGGAEVRRRAQEATFRFMNAVAGDLPGFEDAVRALYADDSEAFDAHVVGWPDDVRDHARRLAERAFGAVAS